MELILNLHAQTEMFFLLRKCGKPRLPKTFHMPKFVHDTTCQVVHTSCSDVYNNSF